MTGETRMARLKKNRICLKVSALKSCFTPWCTSQRVGRHANQRTASVPFPRRYFLDTLVTLKQF